MLSSIKVPITPCQCDCPHVVFLIIFNIELTCCNVTYCACGMDQKHLCGLLEKPKFYILDFKQRLFIFNL